MEVLNNILALPSHKIMFDRKRINGVIHVNIILQNINTTYKYSEIIQDKIVPDYRLLNEYTVLPPQTTTSTRNKRDIATMSTTVPFIRHKYPILIKFGIPTDYLNP